MHIALLEDNSTNSKYIQTLLELQGHQVFPYPYGQSLLAALRTSEAVSRYDAIIIDLWLPNSLSGHAVMLTLQERFPAKPLPFIVVSASSWLEFDHVRTDFPDIPIIRKPFRSQQLAEAIARVTGTAAQKP